MADGQMAFQLLEGFGGENVANQPFVFINELLLAVAGNDSRAFLASVLKRLQS